ncbi:MAG: phytanoyl-CoA dioxygenase family protein [Silicimonas sp.]|nr:phytanoyl-CoA dioxygenase family protein [Silicimonas sp.]
MISAQDVETFEKQGYLVVEDLLDEATLEAIRAEYAEVMDGLYETWHAAGLVPATTPDMGFWEKLDVAYRGGFDWYQPFDISLPQSEFTAETPMHFGPAVFDMITHARVLDTVEALIGGEITSNPIQHVRIKPPERAVEAGENRAHIIATDWHQDMGVTSEEADQTQFVTVWLAITDATVENGCLQVASGDYDEILPHCAMKQVGIAKDHLPKGNATPTPVKAGGAVIFHPLTPHASLTNRSDGYRWSFDLRYNVTGQPTGRGHFPDFVARSRANPETELKDWRQWRDMWVETRNTLAQQAFIPQHGRWDNDAPYCA